MIARNDYNSWILSGTAYFVFGENMNVYTTNDPTHKEFIEAGLEFIRQFTQLLPLPIYKYYHTKGYKAFVQATRRMRELGRLLHGLACSMCLCHEHKLLLCAQSL